MGEWRWFEVVLDSALAGFVVFDATSAALAHGWTQVGQIAAAVFVLGCLAGVVGLQVSTHRIRRETERIRRETAEIEAQIRRGWMPPV